MSDTFIKGRWTKQETDFFIENYTNKSNQWLSDQLNRPVHSIKLKAQILNIHKSKDYMESLADDISVQNRIYSLDEHYFKNIDDQNKAYFLGFIYADGCVMPREKGRSKRFRFALHKKDIKLVQKLKECLKAEHPLRTHAKDAVCIEIASRELYDDLLSHNIIPRKSYTYEFPTNIPDNLLSHYIRGCFDGDGCIHCSKDVLSRIHFTICGNEKFCTWALEIIRKYVDIKGSVVKESTEGVYDCSIGGRRQVAKVGKWIYNGAEIYLERKYNKFKERGLLD